jgi:hypothetical protein
VKGGRKAAFCLKSRFAAAKQALKTSRTIQPTRLLKIFCLWHFPAQALDL